MLRYAKPLVTCGLVFLLAACGGQSATVSTGQSVSTATAAPSAAASTAPSAAPSTAPATATVAPTATTAATPTTAATATTAPSPTVAATATTARTATTAPAAASPTRSAASSGPSAAPSASGQRTPTVPAAGGGTTVTDSDNRCQMTMPAGMTEDSPGSGEFTLNDDEGFALLQSIQGVGLDTTVDPFIQSFTPVFTNYQETNRVKTADSERIDFTGELIFELKGTMYFKQFDNVVCNVILIVYDTSTAPYDQILETMIGSLQAVKP